MVIDIFFQIFSKKNLKMILGDYQSISRRDPAYLNKIDAALNYSGFHAIVVYRVSHIFFVNGMPTFAKFLSNIARAVTGIEIHPGAKIGRNFFIDHGSGVVIGETATVGDNCLFYHGVTLGAKSGSKGKRHPNVGSNVVIGAGAVLIGDINVSPNTIVKANSLITSDI